MDFTYKLTMFGFPDLCTSLEDVYLHLKQLPVARAAYETLDQCYLIDLKTGEKFDVAIDEKGFHVLGLPRP
ncbi:hypothetical protein BKH43_02620 [Helicobacter sp. 13S00401-1]|uniref:hypothetical protein n=1 Tax=Helicobacter sp. 13S00401-1 TaxID=1905758 RepID=UPI000BA5DB72|nr:hypothetical protein [Helicobacter sp. 13S00401-1]PAF51118.1 hypothetical protein BKH43_02620 [Helicobacter sp. 13S00401-1]